MAEVEEVEAYLQKAARIVRLLPDREKRLQSVYSNWPDYAYELDDLKDQQPERLRMRPSAADIDLLEKVLSWFCFLGMRTDKRTVMGKKIVWARANGFSYRQIAPLVGVSPMTCQLWYKADLGKIVARVLL